MEGRIYAFGAEESAVAQDILFNDKLLCIGHPADNGPGPHPKIWFNKWFCRLEHVGSMTVVAPGCIWHREGNKITKTWRDDYERPSGKPNPAPQIWILTGEVDDWGFHLGVWPD